MTADYVVRTNNVPRDVIDACELTPDEREGFDYLNWPAIDNGEDSATFFRYKGQLYDIGEFMRSSISSWDGFQADTFFSATVIRLVDYEKVIVGRVYS